MSADQRRSDYLRLLRQAPAITEIDLPGLRGRDQLRISRLAMNVVGSGIDYSSDPKFLRRRGRARPTSAPSTSATSPSRT